MKERENWHFHYCSFVFSCLNSTRLLGNCMSLADPKEKGWALKTVFSIIMYGEVKVMYTGFCGEVYGFSLYFIYCVSPPSKVIFAECASSEQTKSKWKFYLTIVCACLPGEVTPSSLSSHSQTSLLFTSIMSGTLSS